MDSNQVPHRQEIHLIGNSHIDPVWFWPWTEGFSEVKSTFRAALDRLKEYPDFVFTCAGACYYEWVEQCCPEMFEEIRAYVGQGRWVPVNGWWIQPDCNIPSGESFARQSLYGQRYYLEKFGFCCDVGYNVDSFGHSAMLPQILQKSNMKSYVFMRPNSHENSNLHDVFAWESADGSVVKAFRIIGSYGTQRLDILKDRIEKFSQMADEQGLPLMLFHGVGNHGGGPTIRMMNYIEKQRPANPQLVYSSPSAYTRKISPEHLPVWKGDLQYHAIGCYSAMLTVKQQNRKSETALIIGEKAAALGHMLFGIPQQGNLIAAGWKKVMFNQFHDLICGCSIKKAYEDATASYGYAQQLGAEVTNMALQKISWEIDTLGGDTLPCNKDEDWKLWGLGKKGTPVVLFNSLPFALEEVVPVSGELCMITSEQGEPMLIQRVRSAVTNGEKDKYNTAFKASLPALGYATYWVHKGPYNRQDDAVLNTQPDFVENEFLKLVFDLGNGCISQITSKKTGEDYLKGFGSVGLVIDETHSDTWGHDLFEYRDVLGSFEMTTMDWIQRGPLCSTMRIKSEYGDSKMEQDITLYRDSDYVDIRLRVNWREEHKMLKLEFPVNVTDGQMTAEIPYGTIQRPMDGWEKPIQRWIDVSGEQAGLAVVNDSSHAADVKDGTIRITVLRSPIFADHFGVRDKLCDFTEQGEREVRYRLVPHSGNWRKAGVVRHAMILNTPIMPLIESYHKGTLPQRLSGIAIDKDNIAATVLKEAEDGQAYVLRCYETDGVDTTASISLPLANRTWTAQFGKCEIKSFSIPYDEAEPVTEVDLIERSQAQD